MEEIRSFVPDYACIIALSATTERLRKDASRLIALRNEV